jgi:hypothetical protein
MGYSDRQTSGRNLHEYRCFRGKDQEHWLWVLECVVNALYFVLRDILSLITINHSTKSSMLTLKFTVDS